MEIPLSGNHVNNFLYWKPENEVSQWRLIQNTPEARQAAINAGAMFFTWADLSAPYEPGKPEPVRYGDCPFDFDAANPADALADARKLTRGLTVDYGLSPHSFTVFASGEKGFHVLIDAKIFGAEGGDPLLPRIYQKIAVKLNAKYNLRTLDMSLYAMGKGKMFRLPNVKRRNGRFKVLLSFNELTTLSMPEIDILTQSQRGEINHV
jgi:putative DNA primase/helicase